MRQSGPANHNTGFVCWSPTLCLVQHLSVALLQDNSGVFAPILPREELEAMYHSILEREIPLPNAPAAARQLPGSTPRRGIQASRLAAALGLSHMFRHKLSTLSTTP